MFPRATYYRWKQLYGGLGPLELREMCHFEEEKLKLKLKLKRLVVDLSLDKAMPPGGSGKKVQRLGLSVLTCQRGLLPFSFLVLLFPGLMFG